jgi:transposase
MENEKKQRKYSAEMRIGAVRLVLDEGRKAADVARSLGIGQASVTKWAQQARVDRGQNGTTKLTSNERAEFEAVKRENRQLKLEREILKKATAFFVKENA